MSINLIQKEDKLGLIEKKVIFKKFIYNTIFSLIVWGCVNLYFSFILINTNKKVAALEKEFNNYTNLQKKIEASQNELDELNKKLKILKSFYKRDFFWSEKLLILTKSMPNEMWLENLKIEKVDKKEILKLNGYIYASDTQEKSISILNNFIKSLKEDEFFFKDFADINLVDAKATIKEINSVNINKNILRFELNIYTKE